jgi:hypothetical protein
LLLDKLDGDWNRNSHDHQSYQTNNLEKSVLSAPFVYLNPFRTISRLGIFMYFSFVMKMVVEQ